MNKQHKVKSKISKSAEAAPAKELDPAGMGNRPFLEDERAQQLHRLVARLRKGGVAEASILSQARMLNTRRCQPPLPESDVLAIAKQPARAAARPKIEGEDIKIRRLLERIHRGGKYAYWWRPNPSRSEWYEVDSRPAIPLGQEDVYWPAHPLDSIPDTNAQGEAAPPERVRGRIEHVSVINCLFADIDAKGTGGKDEALAKVQDMTPAPNAIVDSGHGYHCYWIFDTPEAIASPQDRRLAIARQAAWINRVGGDPGAKDLARILRVPGTINVKEEQKVAVRLVELNDGAYCLPDLEALLPSDWMDGSPISQQPGALNTTLADGAAWKALQSLADWRKDDYPAWIKVGMALRQLGRDGLLMWDAWSKTSAKYKWGECARKWQTFTTGEGGDLTLASLAFWADADAGPNRPTACYAPTRGALVGHHVTAALDALGYRFRWDDASDTIEVNGVRISDAIRSAIRWQLAEFKYRSTQLLDDSMVVMARARHFHPVKEYLESRSWDGDDHITKLGSYFTDDHGVFTRWLHLWLLGAVGRIYGDPTGVRGEQNRVLVLNGPQDIGKSYFVRWLAKEVPALHAEGSFNLEDKDEELRKTEVWIWEMGEFGAVVRRHDREAIKHFFTREKVRVRRSYGMYDTEKPPITSFICTLNDTAGFLDDASGYRRFLVTSLTRIDWAYAEEVDVGQVWAQAKALYDKGERGYVSINSPEGREAEGIARGYEMAKPIEEAILERYVFDPEEHTWYVRVLEVMQDLRVDGLGRAMGDQEMMQAITEALRKHGAVRIDKRIGQSVLKVYRGVRTKTGTDRAKEREEMS